MNLAYARSLLMQPLAAAANNRGRFAALSLTMTLNNVLFFLLWVIFFAAVGQVKGWHLSEVALFQGVGVIAFGMAFFMGDGATRIARRILSGELDSFMVRPRHPLPQLVTLEADASCPGDILYGVILLVAFAHLDLAGFVLALASALLIATLFVAMAITFQSLAFYLSGGGALAEQLLNMMMCLGFTPQHTQPMLMKFILFTVLPAGFMVILPVDIVRHHSPSTLLILASAVSAYMGFAVWFFNRGVRRYTSATGWTA
jgi:ABC-2 type transport system permease protein